MIGIRIDGDTIWLEPEEWDRWIQDGRIPPQAQVQVEGRGWVRAADLESYRNAVRGVAVSAPSGPGLRPVLFPRRGLSATETLILVNVAVTVVLLFVLGSRYLSDIRSWTGDRWGDVQNDGAYWWWLATIFMHAGPRHLGGNMVSLLGAAGAVEFLMGRRWAYGVYLLTGIAGMASSFIGHDGPPLSIGASGAVFGLVGCTVTFILRRRRMFTYRQRWKARRVYLPLFIVLFLPSLLQADYFGHTGGLAAGLLLGALIPPHRRVRDLSAEDVPPPAGAAGT
jgi:rhomboid protease GluP